jgi:hypothetical protein
MDRELINTCGMFKKTYSVLDFFSTTIMKNEELQEDVTIFKSDYLELDSSITEYKKPITGTTEDKNNDEAEAVNIVWPIKSALLSLANKTSNKTLLNIVNFSKSQLKVKTREGLRKNVLINVLNEADKNAAELAKRNVSAEKLTAARAKINALDTAKSTQNTSETGKTALLKKIIDLSQKMSGELKNLIDPLMETMLEGSRDFYDQYFAARVIYDLGGGHGGGDDETPPENPPENK